MADLAPVSGHMAFGQGQGAAKREAAAVWGTARPRL